MRQLSTAFLRESFKQETGVCPIFLLTISHPSLVTPIRVSSDPTERLSETASQIVYGTTSRGNEYTFFPFSINIPNDEADSPAQMQIQLDNVNRELTSIIRSLSSPPTITTEIVLDTSLDDVEITWPEFLMTQIEYGISIKGTLCLELLEREPYPALNFTPSYFGGLF